MPGIFKGQTVVVKNKYYFILFLVLLAACSRKDTLTPAPRPVYIKDSDSLLKFKIIPLAPNQLKISFQYVPGGELTQLMLKKDTATLGTWSLSKDAGGNFFTTIIYNFDAGQKYNLVVQSGTVNDTSYRYTTPNYIHIYVNPFTYQKLLPLSQSLGPNAFDISPSRNTLFISDDIRNNVVTKRLSLKDLTVDTIKFGSNINPLMIRAVSDDELIVKAGGYNKPVPGSDSTGLIRYNVKTGQSTFIDFVSQNYGRFSRVINNHILITHPFFTPANASLINLSDNSKIDYPTSTVDPGLIAENYFDHLYCNNNVINPATGGVTMKLPLPDSSGIEYIDDATQHTFVSKYVLNNTSYQSQLLVYSQNNLVYQGDYSNARLIQIGRQLSISNNRVLFYQAYGYDTTFRIDGYYLLDLNTKQVSLVQCDSNPSVIDDFQLDGHTVISVRSDGVYKILVP
jgi:hypothetical protein